MVGAGGFDGMDFDALEAMQCHAGAAQGRRDRREGGAVARRRRCLGGPEGGRWSNDLLSSALSRSDTPLGLTVLDGRTQDLSAPGVLEQLVAGSGRLLHRVHRWDEGYAADAQWRHPGLQHLGAGGGHGLVSTQFFMTPPPNRDLLGLPGGEDRTDVPDQDCAVFGAAHLADHRHAGGVPELAGTS